MGKKDKDYKFVVGKIDGRSSKVWSVKFRKSDIYIMNDHGKDHKISLHKSGVCHSALTQEASSRFGMEPKKRTAVRWKLFLEEYESAIAFSIVFYYNQLGKYKVKKLPNKIKEIPTPPVNSAVIVQFIKTKACDKIMQYDFSEGIYLLDCTTLESGEVLTVVYYYTTELNSLVVTCEKNIRRIIEIKQPPKPLTPCGGFVTVTDNNGLAYYVEVKLDTN